MLQRRTALDGFIPKRVVRDRRPLKAPSAAPFLELQKGSSGREVSTTMAFTSLLRDLLRDQEFGDRVVPIVPDEARTFGMDSLFREFKIYAPRGQLYEPVDHDLLLSYSEAVRRAAARGRHHRGRFDGVVDRRGHQLRQHRRADGALLHLLFDVRLPAQSATSPGSPPTPAPAAS